MKNRKKVCFKDIFKIKKYRLYLSVAALLLFSVFLHATFLHFKYIAASAMLAVCIIGIILVLVKPDVPDGNTSNKV